MDPLADELGVRPISVPALRRNPGLHDLSALLALVRILRAQRPEIVHTHAAKAGTLGRVASLLAFPNRDSRPLLVHTFHGHSLSGYFSTGVTSVYRTIERRLGRRTDKLIAVSEEVRDDLVAIGVAPHERFQVVPLGLELSPFVVDPDTRLRMRRALRAELGLPREVKVVTLIARLVPIKRVDRFLSAATMLEDVDDVRFLVVGDGELRDSLHNSREALKLSDRLIWAGFRRDMPQVCFASDVVVLSSDNEGTPVSLIEAAAAGLPTISTNVGGAASVVQEGKTGRLVVPDTGQALAAAMRELLADEHTRDRMGGAARVHVLQRFSLERLVRDLDGLYRQLLDAKR